MCALLSALCRTRVSALASPLAPAGAAVPLGKRGISAEVTQPRTHNRGERQPWEGRTSTITAALWPGLGAQRGPGHLPVSSRASGPSLGCLSLLSLGPALLAVELRWLSGLPCRRPGHRCPHRLSYLPQGPVLSAPDVPRPTRPRRRSSASLAFPCGTTPSRLESSSR